MGVHGSASAVGRPWTRDKGQAEDSAAMAAHFARYLAGLPGSFTLLKVWISTL
jgi:hypothetical protein